LTAKRRAVFRALTQDPNRALVEVTAWSEDLTRVVRAYSAAYREAIAAAPSGEVLRELLLLDTLQLSVEHPDAELNSVVALPTHPLRLLWYAAYADLLRSWEVPLSRLGREEVRRALDMDLVGRIEPMNLPALALNLSNEPVLFAHNLTFFWPVYVAADVRDPGRYVASAATVLGVPGDEDVFGDIPPRRLGDELKAYRDVHPYLETLRLAAVNPGTGKFLADALRPLVLTGSDRDEDTDLGEHPPAPLRVELLAHTDEPVPLELPGLTRFEREVYEYRTRGEPHHLAPLFSVALRPRSKVTTPPGGEVNLTVAFDAFRPRIEVVPRTPAEDSASFYGLLTRMSSSFTPGEGEVRWQHSVQLSPDRARERHPVVAGYTNELVDGHDAYLAAIGRALGRDEDGRSAVVLAIGPESRQTLDGLHACSDWVAFLDRFLGVDFFDYPRDVDLERVSRRYLLDYSPEFVEGLGHRLLVTTAHREEVAEILGRAMSELGLAAIEESVGDVLHHLKTISGRLALRVVGDTARAREAASLGIVAAYLRSRGELDEAILVPVDAHPELFGVHARPAGGTPRQRCDLIRVRFGRGRLNVTFIEVKSRGAGGQAEELANRIVDQIDATDQVFRELFFQRDPVRLDHSLQRARLATILRFYVERAWRHRMISSESTLAEMRDGIDRLDTGIPNMHTEKWGFVVNLGAEPAPPHRLRGALIQVITAQDVQEAGLSTDPGLGPAAVAPPAPAPAASPPEEPATTTPGEAVPPASETEPQAPRVEETVPLGDAGASEGVVPVGTQTAVEPEPRVEPPAPEELAIPLGRTVLDSEPVVWRPSVRGSPHLFILGIPGQGKSWTATRLLVDLAAQGVPALVFDFHGQFADRDGPYFRAASPAILDAASGLPFSPFEAEVAADAGTSFWRTNAFVVAEIFEYVCGLGDIQRDVVYEAVRDCYQAAGFGGEGPTRLPTVPEVAERLEQLEIERRVRNVVPRCRPLLEFGLFQDGRSSPDGFIDLLRHGAVLDTSRQGLEELQLASGAFVLRKVYKEMFRWGETDRLRHVLVLDEAHRLARDISLPKIMKEGRKFGVAAVVASQGLADFHPDVVGNAGTKVVFRTNFPMSKKVAGFLRGPDRIDLAGAVEQLEVGEAYVQTPEMPRAARVSMEPLRQPGA
jgi:DNA phosphorothioation-dependent restriction protein DptH